MHARMHTHSEREREREREKEISHCKFASKQG